jgi:valyl-tRNA synthetase
MEFIQKVISAVRNIRSEMNVPPGSLAELKYKTTSEKTSTLLEKQATYIHSLARIKRIEKISLHQKVPAAAVAVVDELELLVPLAGLIDLELEKNRLTKEIARLEGQVQGLLKKMQNQQYLTKAPEAVVKQDQEKLKNFSEKLEKLHSNLQSLN